MELQAFLQSGLLESYVLGQCSLDEVRTVETMLVRHPEAQAEKTAIEMALEKYAFAHVVAPPMWMKGRILEQIDLLKPLPTPPVPAAASPGKVSISKLGLGAMALVGLLGLLFSGLYFQMKNQSEQQKQQLSEIEKQVADCATREAARSNLQQQIALLNHFATRKVELKSADGSNPTALAMVFDNPELHQTMLGLTNLPALSANQDYQLWVIAEGNPAPQPMDVFAPNVAPDLSKIVNFHAGAQAFAVSIEPKGGSPNGKPTTVVMLGKV